MGSFSGLDLDPVHKPHWEKFKTIVANKRLAQSLLFAGPTNALIEKFINRVIASSLCDHDYPEPCLQCSDCLMFLQGEHPDVLCIQPEKQGAVIKIDQIRMLQEDVYKTPQHGKLRFVILKSAESMNKASANALLKILEEPPTHTHFILVAEQIATLPATILSRCQLWRINPENNFASLTFLALSDTLPTEPDILSQRDRILTDLLLLIKGETIPSILAVNWKNIALNELLWLLYLINAQLIMFHTVPESDFKAYKILKEMATLIKTKNLFYQLDKINALQKKLSHNIHVNTVLAVEDLLMDLSQGECYA